MEPSDFSAPESVRSVSPPASVRPEPRSSRNIGSNYALYATSVPAISGTCFSYLNRRPTKCLMWSVFNHLLFVTAYNRVKAAVPQYRG